MTANGTMIENKECRKVQDLLPGISDHVVLDKVVPKLEWKEFFVLSSVSHAWYDAIRSRRVVDSRIRSRSSQTLVPAYFTHDSIALYSMRENSWRKLPRIADTSRSTSGGRPTIPALGQCISMDGKIYILGGMMGKVSNEVFVFDLAGKGHWEQCASMGHWRRDFGSAVLDGKIYVFGGRGQARSPHISGAEVYNSNENTWSHIRPMITCRYGQHVTPIGEELFIYGGWTKDIGGYASSSRGHSLEAYHPSKDEWRVVHPSWNRPERGLFFSVQGSIFSVHPRHGNLLELLAIEKYDVHGNSWTHVHSFSFDAVIPVAYDSVRECAMPEAILVVDDEVIALVRCHERKGEGRWGLCVLQSRGFCNKNQKISWKLRAIAFEQLPQIPRYFVQKL